MSDELGAKPHIEAGPYVHYCEHLGCTMGWLWFRRRPVGAELVLL